MEKYTTEKPLQFAPAHSFSLLHDLPYHYLMPRLISLARASSMAWGLEYVDSFTPSAMNRRARSTLRQGCNIYGYMINNATIDYTGCILIRRDVLDCSYQQTSTGFLLVSRYIISSAVLTILQYPHLFATHSTSILCIFLAKMHHVICQSFYYVYFSLFQSLMFMPSKGNRDYGCRF